MDIPDAYILEELERLRKMEERYVPVQLPLPEYFPVKKQEEKKEVVVTIEL